MKFQVLLFFFSPFFSSLILKDVGQEESSILASLLYAPLNFLSIIGDKAVHRYKTMDKTIEVCLLKILKKWYMVEFDLENNRLHLSLLFLDGSRQMG